MSKQTPPPPPDVVYSAPKPEALDAFARRVCLQLGTDYAEHDVMEGFSTFIRVATRIQVKYLNKQSRGEVDNDQ